MELDCQGLNVPLLFIICVPWVSYLTPGASVSFVFQMGMIMRVVVVYTS